VRRPAQVEDARAVEEELLRRMPSLLAHLAITVATFVGNSYLSIRNSSSFLPLLLKGVGFVVELMEEVRVKVDK
jgi:hypothetical protein